MFDRLRSKFHRWALPHHLEDFDLHRGRIISGWACVESSIDQANHYAWAYSRKTIAERVPVSLGRKIELFKKINRDLMPFKPLREQAAELLQRVNDLMDDRHWMAHGYLVPNDCPPDSWVLIKHEFTKETGGIATLRRQFREDELIDIHRKIIKLMNQFADYTNALTAQAMEHGADYGNC